MRLARINGTNIDIDNKTAIGLTLQSYDIKQPGKRFINITNSFTIPGTNHNLSVFGFANNPQSTSSKIYELSTFDYWVDNEQLVKDARVRVDSIQDRISLFVFEKPSVWDEIKLVKWPDFVSDFVVWMQDNKGLPSKDNQFSGGLIDFLQLYSVATEGVILPMYFGNLYEYQINDAFVEDTNNIWLRKWGVNGDKADGGHFSVYLKTIFEYIEDKYNVNFLTSGGQVVGNIWDDAIAPTIYTPIRDLTVLNNTAGTSFYFKYDNDSQFLPLKNQKDKADKTLYDCINGYMQHFNIIKDDIVIDNKPAIRLARFDDIETLAEVTDFSDRFTGIPKYTPYIKGYEQENVIKFKEIFPEGDGLVNSKILDCINRNLNPTTDILEIDAYICAFIQITGGVVPDLSVKESFKTFQYFINDGLTDPINIRIEESGNTQSATMQLQKAALYSLEGEYNFLNDILSAPRFYEHEKWLTLLDIQNIEFFRQYFIRELGGSFFINKISGFNPQESKKPTKLELIKISNKTPITPPDLDYWTDGVNDPWTDGIGDIYF